MIWKKIVGKCWQLAAWPHVQAVALVPIHRSFPSPIFPKISAGAVSLKKSKKYLFANPALLAYFIGFLTYNCNIYTVTV